MLCAVLAFLPRTSALMPGADEKWRVFHSKHFELYSRNSESDSRLLLHNLELVHAIFFQTFGFTPIRTVPVTVYFFSREKYFDAYKPEAYRKVDNLAAFYDAEWDRGVLTVAPLPDYDSAQRLAFGSYAFHLFRLLDAPSPAWYTYGVSELFANLVVNSDSLELGKANEAQVQRLQRATLIPVQVMFGLDDKSTAFRANQANNLFHDESWAMVHYLYFGKNQLPPKAVSEFVGFALKNTRNFDAEAVRRKFQDSLGLSYETMNEDLDHYFHGGRYGWQKLSVPAVEPARGYEMRKVPLDEINLRLAEVALEINRSAQGKLILLQALDQPRDDAARINEVLGADAIKDGDWDGALDRWKRAVAAGSSNPAVLHELCLLESQQRFRQFDLYYRLPDDTAAELRSLLKKTIAAEPQLAAAYELLAWVEATANAPQIPNINLVQANFPRLQQQDRTLLALALVRLRLDDKAGAVEILNALDRSGPSDWVRSGAEQIRAKLENRPVNPDRRPDAKPEPDQSVPQIKLDLENPG